MSNQKTNINTPKVWNKLKEFITNRLKENVKLAGFEAELNDFSHLTDDWFNFFITHNRRILYDFFDEEKLFISINYRDNIFLTTLNTDIWEQSFKTRLEAENFIFNKAMEVLENKV